MEEEGWRGEEEEKREEEEERREGGIEWRSGLVKDETHPYSGAGHCPRRPRMPAPGKKRRQDGRMWPSVTRPTRA